jgi:hypothetical protein
MCSVFAVFVATSTAGVSSTMISGSFDGSTGGVLSRIAPNYATARPRLPGAKEDRKTTESTEDTETEEEGWFPFRKTHSLPDSVSSVSSVVTYPARNRSASMAAMQPVPAAVTA